MLGPQRRSRISEILARGRGGGPEHAEIPLPSLEGKSQLPKAVEIGAVASVQSLLKSQQKELKA